MYKSETDLFILHFDVIQFLGELPLQFRDLFLEWCNLVLQNLIVQLESRYGDVTLIHTFLFIST